jgi:CheY-like chemotaxis protein
VRAAARRVLERHGHAVVEARHGADALLVWAEHRDAVDAVVTDLRMPELGGRELVARLRAERPSLPVVYMSGYAEPGPTAGGAHEAFVEKPFTGDTLLAAVDEVLEAAAP